MATPTQQVIEIVVEKIVTAFEGDPALFEAWLVRSKLETELKALESAQRLLQAGFGTEQAAYSAASTANTDAQNALRAAIDALEG